MQSLAQAAGHRHAQSQPFKLLPLARQVFLHVAGLNSPEDASFKEARQTPETDMADTASDSRKALNHLHMLCQGAPWQSSRLSLGLQMQSSQHVPM